MNKKVYEGCVVKIKGKVATVISVSDFTIGLRFDGGLVKSFSLACRDLEIFNMPESGKKTSYNDGNMEIHGKQTGEKTKSSHPFVRKYGDDWWRTT